MPLAELHCRLALAVIFFAFALGVWGGFLFLRGLGVSGSYLGAVAVGELLVIAQGLVGVVLVLTGRFPADGLHFLYGVVIAISWVAVYLYSHGETGKREMGIYALMSFIVVGLTLRAVVTGASGSTCIPF